MRSGLGSGLDGLGNYQYYPHKETAIWWRLRRSTTRVCTSGRQLSDLICTDSNTGEHLDQANILHNPWRTAPGHRCW